LSDEFLHVGDLVVVKNHGDQWPHQACIVQIDTENKLAMIQWVTTQKTDSVDLEDLKRFFNGGFNTKKTKIHQFFFSHFRKKNCIK
jgi:hypothetical protein